MTAEAWQTLSQMLDRLLEMPTAKQQAELAALRATDPALCAELESLLEEQDTAGLFEAPPSRLFDGIPAPSLDVQFDAGMAGRYVIQEEIARGGMGAVFKALDPQIGRMLAVKVLLPQARAHPEVESWFDREARITGRLQHPGVPPVHEMGRLADRSPYFVMKLIDWRTLSEAIREPDWPSRCIGVFEQICRTLAYAHSKKIIHRDLKPSNVMIGQFGEVQVMDWGLAKSIEEPPPGESETSTIVGTPAYMAPEQARGDRDLDERCDVFGLGALLCAMMAGKPPYTGATPEETRQCAIRAETAGALRALAAAGTDADLLAIAKRCLAAARDERYRDAGEVADAVTAYRASVAERLRQAELEREKAAVQAAEERRRRRLRMSLVAAVLVLLLGATSVWVWQDRLQTQKAARAADLNGQVARTLDDAESERRAMVDALRDPQSANQLLANLQPWQARLQKIEAAVEQGRKLAESDPEIVTSAQVARLGRLDATLSDDRADLKFAEDLDRLRLELFDPGKLKPGVVATSYRKLFESRGFSVAQSPQAETARRLSESPVRFMVVAALDDWANAVAFGNPRDDATLATLLALARQLDPDPWRDRFRQPEVWTDAGQVARLTDELNLREQSPQVLRIAAAVQGQHKLDAATLLSRSLRVYPADFWLLYQYGFTTMFTDGAASHSAFRGALALRPRNAYVLNSLGITSSLRQDYEGAEDFLRQAIELQPRFPDAVCNLAKCRYEQGDYAGAIAEYRRAQKLGPDLVECWNGLGAAYCWVSEFDQAMKSFDQALQLSPENPSALGNRRMIEEAVTLRSQVAAAEGSATTRWESLSQGITDVLTTDHPFDCFQNQTKHRRAGYRVELSADTTYQFDLVADYDPMLRIEDDQFRPLLHNNDRHPEVRDSRLIFTPPASGSYRLVVTSVAPGKTGSYTLRGRKTSRTAEPMRASGTLTRRNTVLQNRYVHVHPVAFAAGQPVIVHLESRAFNTKLWLMDGAGKTYIVSAERMHPFNGHWSRLDFTPSTSGPFKVIVTTAEMDRIGPYSMTIEQFDDLDRASRPPL